MGINLKDFKQETEDLIKELKEIRNGIDLDYFDFSLTEKTEIYNELNRHISFIDGLSRLLNKITEEINSNKLNKQEREEKENKLNKLLLFFIEEIEERQKEIEKMLDKYFSDDIVDIDFNNNK
jgi:hypothetical protein